MEARSGRADLRGDTIAAVATPPGIGALALVRVSGPQAFHLAGRAVRAQGSGDKGQGTETATTWPPAARRATRVTLIDADGAPLDDALVTVFPAPHSATGEDVVEFSVHGGAYIATTLLTALVTAGARPALPGEFTERAVRNGKLDLLQAEGIADLIEARSAATHRAALQQLGGALSRQLETLRSALLDLEALLAYDIDFPMEDDGPIDRSRILAAATALESTLAQLIGTFPQAALGRDGAMVVLAGPPNAGKSSLLNALVGESRAIVSEIPGTTRDAIEVLVDAQPWPIRYVDTAGLRTSEDPVERLGIEVSHRRLAEAHLVLACGEDEASLGRTVAELATRTTAPIVAVWTKRDQDGGRIDSRGAVDGAGGETHVVSSARAIVRVSAQTGLGLDALQTAIRAALATVTPEPTESLPTVTRARHVASLAVARGEISAFREAWEDAALPAPVAATHLRAAVHALDELLGGIDIEEILTRVFRTFCVGK
ncbi:MAG: putative tRNA modification GTPase TrmE [Gemmatimonadota bacterium]